MNTTDTGRVMDTQAKGLTTAALILEGISKSFGGTLALQDVSLTAYSGEVHALLGENGAGKSTLMNIATGMFGPDNGSIVVGGEEHTSLTPTTARDAGIAIVHQHPAVVPDLTVYENLLISLPARALPKSDRRSHAQALIDRVALKAHLDERVERLSVAERHLLEIAKALASSPKVLVLDEPTAPLGSDSVELLYGIVRQVVESGTAVIYITHRMAEVRDLANRVTVLRDGKLAKADIGIDEVSDEELLSLVVGRRLASAFPAKATFTNESPNLIVEGLTGGAFADISFSARPGEIVGIAGVVGNGQTELVRALVGLDHFDGHVSIDGRSLSSRELRNKTGYMPADRHNEGLILDFSVRENTAFSSLKKFVAGPLMSRNREVAAVSNSLQSLRVKAPSLEAPTSALSGGNQQKIVMARTVLGDPIMVVADEPTQGVDVGARAEIYEILRKISLDGTPVIVVSSDAKELEGLCDKVLVMSRGRAILELQGDEVDEEKMVHTAVSTRTASIAAVGDSRPARKFDRLLNGELPPIVLITLVILGLGALVLAQNGNYLNSFNLKTMMLSVSALGFIALGQTIVMMLGGIDLSVGPLAGLLVVVGTFFFSDGSALGSILLGFSVMLLVSVAVGLINGSLIRYVHFTSIAATLALYIGLQGVSFVLRPRPGGTVDREVIDFLGATLGAVPVVFIVLVVVTIGLEISLRKTRWGMVLRAVGSSESNARQIGIGVNWTVIGGFVAGSVLTFMGAIVLAQQLGVGDAAQGIGYTLTSITAVVLGGTSIFGGRGTFIGTLLGSILLVQVLNATVFFRMDQLWQYLLQGILILVAMLAYSFIRPKRRIGT
ncbi:ATP-binding cassette domain-containing protein [Leucobacter sp. W1038]|uniref:ATP-binding cassette domain-containing protein n=1 Tax=Leucobacter sp. W1038 TaxID=3438281 RepID=UPI003D953933